MKAAGSRSMGGSTQISNNVDAPVEPCSQPLNAEELAKSDLWIFRDGRREFSGPAFLQELQQQLASSDGLLDCLIQAGEMEAALADLGAHSAQTAAYLTDTLARDLQAGNTRPGPLAQQLVAQIVAPNSISVSPPEGFTYYALHPSDFARAAEKLADRARTFAVVGIRSIGTTLSAVVAAALDQRGKVVSRTTVRPGGHPYARNADFTLPQKQWIQEQLAGTARFLIVDEGPGRSGSTFLSVGEALCACGVPQERITIIGSRQFDPSGLFAKDAAARWRQFHFVATTPALSTRFPNWTYLGSGDWRAHFLDGEQEWPESWTQMERFKVLSPDQRDFVKFEGMGRIGREARIRAFILADAGFSPAAADAGDGFVSYSSIKGRRLNAQDVNSSFLAQVARYCAFRAKEFRQLQHNGVELHRMLTHNVQQEFARELNLPPDIFATAEPALVDGRMQPYEWISSETTVLKTDGISHGDDHFFPGPCGMAWDLAGVAVEWNLDQEATDFLVGEFRQLSGTNVGHELPAHMLAYCVFRLGFCKMARSTVLGTAEEKRLHSAYLRYRSAAAQLLNRTFAIASVPSSL
jgi:hypothetical protein